MNKVRIDARAGRVLCAALIACVLPFVVPAHAGPACPATPLSTLRLPHLRAALAAKREGLIVALGSSSTRGFMASDPGHSYPAVLQDALDEALPSRHVAVINRGIGGQDAPEELARMQADVLAVRPELVIWQVGANGAMHHADPARFARLVTEGVQRMQAAGIDVVLMDNQHSPKVDATPEGVLLDEELGSIAKATGASLFSRAALMDTWQEEGVPMLRFISTDRLHHNDRGYACVARALARDIVAALHPPKILSARR